MKWVNKKVTVLNFSSFVDDIFRHFRKSNQKHGRREGDNPLAETTLVRIKKSRTFESDVIMRTRVFFFMSCIKAWTKWHLIDPIKFMKIHHSLCLFC